MKVMVEGDGWMGKVIVVDEVWWVMSDGCVTSEMFMYFLVYRIYYKLRSHKLDSQECRDS